MLTACPVCIHIQLRCCYRAATRDVTSIVKSLPWGKTVWASYGKRAFSLLHVCYSACKCHYDSRREEGEYYERSKSTASRFWVMLGELLPIISIF